MTARCWLPTPSRYVTPGRRCRHLHAHLADHYHRHGSIRRRPGLTVVLRAENPERRGRRCAGGRAGTAGRSRGGPGGRRCGPTLRSKSIEWGRPDSSLKTPSMSSKATSTVIRARLQRTIRRRMPSGLCPTGQSTVLLRSGPRYTTLRRSGICGGQLGPPSVRYHDGRGSHQLDAHRGRIEALRSAAPTFVQVSEQLEDDDYIGVMASSADPSTYDPIAQGHTGTPTCPACTRRATAASRCWKPPSTTTSPAEIPGS